MFSYLYNFAATIPCNQGADGNINGIPTGLPTTCANNTTLQPLLAIVFGVIAAVAVLIIIIQGIRFVLSQGDPQKSAAARKGVIYAVVGLGVAVSAEVIVNFVIGRI